MAIEKMYNVEVDTEKMRTDRKYALELIDKHPAFYEELNVAFRNDPNIAIAAAKRGQPLDRIEKKLQYNIAVIKAGLEFSPRQLRDVDPDIQMKLIKENKELAPYASDKVKGEFSRKGRSFDAGDILRKQEEAKKSINKNIAPENTLTQPNRDDGAR